MEEFTMENIDGEDFVASQHDRLVNAISKLDKTQHIKLPTRQECMNFSEFNLVKKCNKVDLSNVAKLLGSTAHKVQLGQRLGRARSVTSLPRPAERPQRERARRVTGYDAAKRTVGRWDAAVARARSLDCVSFPLIKSSKLEQSGEPVSKLELKSQLQRELETVEPPRAGPMLGAPGTARFTISYEEALEQRHERARLRAQQSYREAKAKRQNKIKSKKYHRILKKEKLKNQLKEFEELQSKDPEEALKRLELLEKARALERHTLRHKNTGKWAKSKLVRAKYDKEVRQQLAEQLAVSRGLTRRRTDSASSADSAPAPYNPAAAADPVNPWLVPADPAFAAGYSSYLKHALDTAPSGTSDSDEAAQSADELNPVTNQIYTDAPQPSSEINMNAIATTKWHVQKVYTSTTDKNGTIAVDKLSEAFESYEDIVAAKIKDKLNSLRNEISNLKDTVKLPKRNRDAELDPVEYLKFKNRKKVPSLNEELIETGAVNGCNSGKPAAAGAVAGLLTAARTGADDNIDPGKFIEVKPKHLKSIVLTEEQTSALDDEEQVVPRVALEDVFEEDDVVDSFRREKAAERAGANEDANAGRVLPGWGAWGGLGVRAPRRRGRRRARFLPAPAPEVRRDENKGDIIIKEFKNPKLIAHKVSDVPFPFVSVKEYEASIRTPLGNTFVTEKAHRKLIQPNIVTKVGAIIEPMDESDLLLKNI